VGLVDDAHALAVDLHGPIDEVGDTERDEHGSSYVVGVTHATVVTATLASGCSQWLMRVLSWTSHRGPTLSDDRRTMGLRTKIFVALAVVLPLGAFVAGSLARADQEQPPRQPIIIQDDSSTPTAPPSRVPRPEPTRPPDDDEAGEDDEPDDHVVTPRPQSDADGAETRNGDDDDGEDDDDDEGGDDD
jgi:hypothetical protein